MVRKFLKDKNKSKDYEISFIRNAKNNAKKVTKKEVKKKISEEENSDESE